MHFPIRSNKFSFNYARFLRKIKEAVQETYAQEQKENGITHEYLAEQLGLTRPTITRRLQCEGNLTLRSLSDLYVAMGRLPLENFSTYDTYDWEANIVSDNLLEMFFVHIHKRLGSCNEEVIDENKNNENEFNNSSLAVPYSLIKEIIPGSGNIFQQNLELNQ